MNCACFKAYDIRGKIPGELNEGLAYRISGAYAAEIKSDAVVSGTISAWKVIYWQWL